MEVLVGILASNQKAKTLACLESLAASTGAGAGHDVLLVDNASSERIGEAVRDRFPAVTIDVQPRNTGCAGGRNLVRRHFLAGDWPYLFFLDNDAVVRPDTISCLLASARDRLRAGHRLGGLGPHVVYRSEPSRLWVAGGARIDWEQAWFAASGQGGSLERDFRDPRRLDTLTGGFMFMTREAIASVEPFAEDYFIYVEDTDWCWRLVRAGFELWSAPEAVVLHDVSSSIGQGTPRFHYLRIRNRMWFFQAYAERPRRLVRSAILRHVLHSTLLPELGDLRLRAALAVVRGYLAGLRVPASIAALAAGARS